MKNYLNFETEIKNLEVELEKLKDPYNNSEEISEVNTDKINDIQQEIEKKYEEVESMYRAYQQEKILLTDNMKIKREEAIINIENQAIKLQKKYFGPEGMRYL